MGLTIVGFHKEGRWLSPVQIAEMAQSNGGIGKLEDISLRVYGPEDYHVRLRRYFEEKGSMRLPAPGEIEDAQAGEGRGEGRIAEKMSRSGVTQAELAGHLGCTQQFLSKGLNGRRSWPEGMLGRAEAYLEAKGVSSVPDTSPA